MNNNNYNNNVIIITIINPQPTTTTNNNNNNINDNPTTAQNALRTWEREGRKTRDFFFLFAAASSVEKRGVALRPPPNSTLCFSFFFCLEVGGTGWGSPSSPIFEIARFMLRCQTRNSCSWVASPMLPFFSKYPLFQEMVPVEFHDMFPIPTSEVDFQPPSQTNLLPAKNSGLPTCQDIIGKVCIQPISGKGTCTNSSPP